MGWFDNNSNGFGFQSPDPSGLTDEQKAAYDYKAAQAKTLRKQAMAKALLESSMQADRGQIVPGGVQGGGGIYVPPSKTATIAKLAQMALSAYAMNRTEDDLKTMGEQGRTARDYQLSHLNDAATTTNPAEINALDGADADRQQAMDEATRAKVAAQLQAQAPQPTMVQTSPTPQAPQQPAPTASVTPNPRSVPSAAATPPASGPLTNQVPTYDAMGNVTGSEDVPVGPSAKPDLKAIVQALKGASNVSASDIQALPAAISGAGTSTAGAGRGSVNRPPVIPAPQAPQQPAPLPMAQASAALQGQPPVAPPAQAQPSPLMPPPQADAAQPPVGPQELMGPANHTSRTRPANQLEMLSRLENLAKTSPEAAGMVDQLRAQMMGQKNEWDIKDGYLINKTKGSVQKLDGAKVLETKDTPNGIMERTEAGWRPAQTMNGAPVMGNKAQKVKESNNEQESAYQNSKSQYMLAQNRLLGVIGDKNTITQAKGDLGNFLASKLPWATETAESRSKIKEALGGMVLGALSGMKSAGVGTGAFNSDAEGKRLADSVADIDFEHLSGPALQQKIMSVLGQANDAISRLEAARANRTGTGQPVAPQAAPKGGLLSGRF